MFQPLASAAASLALAAALAVVPAVAQTVKVGSKNFTEQFVVAEIYAAALEGAGLRVERKINLGGSLIAHKAITTGEIDVYPEYTGTALNTVLKAPVVSDPDAVYRQVKEFYEREFQITWLPPSRINNGYAMLVRPETAAEHRLKTLSDLARVSSRLKLAAGTEFTDRFDGLPGLKQVYGIVFAEFRQFAALALRYDALTSRQVDVTNGFSTDWQIATGKLVALDDDKGLFPPYYLSPVVRLAALQAIPKLAETLNRLGPLLDNEVMRDLNARVEVKNDEPRDVARAFLREKGVLR